MGADCQTAQIPRCHIDTSWPQRRTSGVLVYSPVKLWEELDSDKTESLTFCRAEKTTLTEMSCLIFFAKLQRMCSESLVDACVKQQLHYSCRMRSADRPSDPHCFVNLKTHIKQKFLDLLGPVSLTLYRHVSMRPA